MIRAGFDEATRRDPEHRRTWICLLDGNAHQIDRVTTEAEARDVPVTIIVDFIHVLEYLSAPRSARLYPPFSGEGLEENLWVRWLTRNPKGNGDSSMPVNRWLCPGVWGGVSGDPRDMAKARLPESQCPEGASRTPAGKTPETGAAPCIRVQRYRVQPPERGTMPNEGIQGHEWDAYVTLSRTTETNVGSPNGRESYGDTVPVVVAGVAPCQGGREGRPQGQGAQVIGHQQP